MTTKKPSANDEDNVAEEIAAAVDETPTQFMAPEVDAQTENITEWDVPPTSAGTSGVKVQPEDEVPAAVRLVREGVDEADRERRMAAADPDFQP